MTPEQMTESLRQKQKLIEMLEEEITSLQELVVYQNDVIDRIINALKGGENVLQAVYSARPTSTGSGMGKVLSTILSRAEKTIRSGQLGVNEDSNGTERS